MQKCKIGTAVYGMLHYYGVMPVADSFILCHRYGLCELTEYELFLQQIQKDLQCHRKIYFFKEFVCHRWVCNPIVIEELQRETVAATYKEYSLQQYLKAGKAEMVWSESTLRLQDFFSKGQPQNDLVKYEVARLWRNINNMDDFVTLTSQCVENLMLPWKPEAREYMQVMEEIRLMAENMPRWFCKGYSRKELWEREKSRC